MPFRLPTFWLKVSLAVGLALAADLLFFRALLGLNLALFSLALAGALLVANPAVRRHRLASVAFVVAMDFALLQIERPSLVGWLIFAAAIGVAALAPRGATGEDVGRWAVRLVIAALKAIPGPILDARRVMRARSRGARMKVTAVAAAAVLPIAGGAVFLWLFSAANPVISEALGRLRLPGLDVGRLALWAAVAGVAWTMLRPRGLGRRFARLRKAPDLGLTFVSGGSSAVSLIVFNLVFALQNGLDIAFLWSGARLPAGMSFAEYAHRGAYPLIATALLAGLFVLVFLRPGSPTAGSPAIRALVTIWVAQNVFLVASTILRTAVYIDAYALTRLRIAALLWMGLVALGLVLIVWRLLKGRSGSWLINANALAAAVVLTACSVVDLGAVAAAWNVRHAREVGGRGVALDLCHLGQLRGAALISLAELEQRPLPPEFLERVRWKRQEIRAGMVRRQADWRAWRWRDARRLARDGALPGARPAAGHGRRNCDGSPIPPPRPPAAAPLTAPANPRS